MRWLSIFKNELRRLRKDTFLFIALLVMPLALMAPSLMSYSSSGSGAEGLKATPLIAANYDGGQVSLDFINELDKNLLIEQNFSGDILAQYNLQGDPRCAQPGPACDEAVGRARLADKSRQAMLIIPAGLTAAFEADKQTPVALLYDPGADAILTTQIEKVCQGLAIKVTLTSQIESAKVDFTDLSAIGSAEVRAEVNRITNQPAAENNQTAIHVDEVSPSSYQEVKGPGLLETVVPGFATMFAFVMIMFIIGWARDEKANGVFRRLLTTSVRKTDLIGGKMLFGTLVNFVQLAILFGIGLALGSLRGLGFQFNIPAFILISLALGASATTLGLVFASSKLPASLGLAPMFVGAILGGCMMSVDYLPAYLAPLSYLFPQRYAMIGYQDVLMRNGDVLAVLPEVGILVLFSLVFFGIAMWRFDPLD